MAEKTPASGGGGGDALKKLREMICRAVSHVTYHGKDCWCVCVCVCLALISGYLVPRSPAVEQPPTLPKWPLGLARLLVKVESSRARPAPTRLDRPDSTDRRVLVMSGFGAQNLQVEIRSAARLRRKCTASPPVNTSFSLSLSFPFQDPN